jgi:hypothetical protein
MKDQTCYECGGEMDTTGTDICRECRSVAVTPEQFAKIMAQAKCKR